MPFQGWTLPGVMTVGAAQILLKSSGQVPATRTLIAGSGPLPLLYASQLLALGGNIAGYLDTTPPGQWRAALRRFGPSLASVPDLADGIRWMAQLRRARVPLFRGVSGIEASGSDRVESLAFRTADGATHRLPASLVLVHEGVVPACMRPVAGLPDDWLDDQDCYAPVLDAWGESSLPGLFIAGDAAGIGGAKAAVLRGRLAALGVLAKRGVAVEAEAAPIRRALRRALALRPFLDALFRPRREVFLPQDERGVPLRGGYRRPHPRGRALRSPRPEPDEGVHPRRHGPVPGAAMRLHHHPPPGRRIGPGPGRGRLLPRAPAAEARDDRGARIPRPRTRNRRTRAMMAPAG